MLTVKHKEAMALRPKVEDLLRRYRLEWVLRGSSDDEIAYEVRVPLLRKTEKLPDAILQLDADNAPSVEWEEKKSKK